MRTPKQLFTALILDIAGDLEPEETEIHLEDSKAKIFFPLSGFSVSIELGTSPLDHHKIGIHKLLDEDTDSIELWDSIESAERDLFPRIVLHTEKNWKDRV